MSSIPLLSSFSRALQMRQHPLLFGMIHVPALPGSPLSKLSIAQLVDRVSAETEIYAECGIDGLIVENMHDLPYQKGIDHGPEVCATMARLCSACAHTLGANRRRRMLLGVQILAGANRAALAVAQAAEFDFIRAESFVFGHVADEGWMDGCAGELLRYRRAIGADQIAVVTDIKKKHCSHAITADVSVAETARAAELFLADGVILSGAATGEAACPDELDEVRSKCTLPVLIGSGIEVNNVNLFKGADAFIVGSNFKKDGNWRNEIEKNRVENLVEKVRRMERKSE
ncbi:hypothetical protein niasHT_034237 [Heterodera trifolii]|uniref:Uncharacterized protein n=1 Tax=Heterodera trifolii TaxID=157864 RepID=A0ABD2ILF6_9BILA